MELPRPRPLGTRVPPAALFLFVEGTARRCPQGLSPAEAHFRFWKPLVFIYIQFSSLPQHADRSHIPAPCRRMGSRLWF